MVTRGRVLKVLRSLLSALEACPHYHGAEASLDPRRSRILELDRAKDVARAVLKTTRSRR